MRSSKALSSVYAPPRAEQGWRLEDLFPGAAIRYFSFGRRALAAALEAAGARGKGVLLPEFICRDLLSSLAAVGARPVYYAVDYSLRPVEPPSRWPKAAAVLAVNYFGFPQDLEPFREYARSAGAVLIEDNAHGLFSKDASGAPLGARGDLGIFSLRKTLPLPNGAALLVPAGGRFPLPAQQPFEAPDTPRYLAKQALRVAAGVVGAPLSLRGLELLRGARRALTGKRLPPPDPASETNLPEPALPCGQLAQPLRVAAAQSEIRRRRLLYELIGERLKPTGAQAVFPDLPEGACPYGYPFRSSPDEIASAVSALAELGLEPLPWPDLPSALASGAPASYKNVWLAHFLW